MDATPFLRCTRCDTRIGAYEPLWVLRPGDDPVRSSYLAVRDDPRHDDGRSTFLHAACFEPPAPSPDSVDHRRTSG